MNLPTGMDLPTGALVAFLGETPPDGWAWCDGQQGRPLLANWIVKV